MLKKFFTLATVFTTLILSTTAFAFSIAYPADGIYSIQPKLALDKELSVQNHAGNWGANVIIDNINSNWRKWKIQRIPGTHFYSIVAVHSNLAVDVANAQASDGANIATWPFLEGRQNQFAFFDAGGGFYAIKVNLDGNFVLDVERAENRAGANVLSWSFNGGDNQLWRLVMVQRLSAFQSYDKVATKTVPAYVMPDLSSRSGNERVDKGDNVTVLREEGNAYLVRYPVSGGTKTRWVNKNEIFSGSNPTPSPNPTPTPSGDYPSSIYLTQQGSNTCTLVSAAMMLRAKAYRNGNNSWSSITESSIRSTAWSSGLKWSWSYAGMNVEHSKMSGISQDTLQTLLAQHPEGVVIHCGNLPHAVWVNGYSNGTFYCSDPLKNYSGDKRPLANSYLGRRLGSQSNILSRVTAIWYVR